MHISDAQIRSFLDQEVSKEQAERIQLHLNGCLSCQVRVEKVSRTMNFVQENMLALNPREQEIHVSTNLAFSKFNRNYDILEDQNMFRKIFNRKYRIAWSVVGVIALLAVAMLFPQVRAIGSSFLGLFRVEQFTVIQFDPENLEDRLGSSSNFEYLLAEDVVVEEFGEMQEAADVSQAGDLAGFPVRLPDAIQNPVALKVQPGTKLSMQVDLNKVQALVDEIGETGLVLPAELDGAEVSMTLPVAVMATFGECEVSPEMIHEAGVDPDGPLPDLSQCVTLTQFPSPEINAPPGLNIGALGEIFLQLLGMTPEEAAQFSQSVDWTTTLVVPIPRYGTEYQNVPVDGVEGTLILQSQRSEFPHYLLIWIKEGVVYALTGPGSTGSALEIANSLE